MNRADNVNIVLLPHIVAYIYKHVPLAVWGSAAKVKKQLEHGRELAAQLAQMLPEGGDDVQP